MTALIVGFYLFLVVTRVATAARLDLFGDEAFYFLCSRYPDVAYADHPFMTAMLVRGGVAVVGQSPLGVRLLFLVIGALFPFAIYRLAAPIVGARDAFLAAGASLVIPAFAHLGILALPDVPLLLFAALALHGFDRAVETGSVRAWLLTGVATALGLSTHYRGALIPLAFLVYALATPTGRRQWRVPAAWLAGSVALTGLLPVLIYNIRRDFAPLRFQGAERHNPGFDWEGFGEYLPLQMGAVGPTMFVALIAVLVVCCRGWRRGDDSKALLAIFALAHVGLFFVLSPFTDSEHATIHWPAAGYIPLVVMLPPVLRAFLERSATLGRRVLVALVPGFGALVLMLILLELSTGLFNFQPLHRPFAGWSRVSEMTRTVLGKADPGALVIADNYMLGGNLALNLDESTDVYFLRHPKNVEHGRAAQFPQWQLGEEALPTQFGRDAILVLEKTRVRRDEREAWRKHCLSFLERPKEQTRLVIDADMDSEKVFVFYRGRVRAVPKGQEGDPP